MNSGGVPGVMTADFYNSLGAMHGTIMVFLGIVPVAFAAFGNYVVPLQIGAPDMTFPKINMASFHSFWIGGRDHARELLLPDRAGQERLDFLSAALRSLRTRAPGMFTGQTLWILGMVFLITSSLLGAVNFVTTIIQLRAPGMTWMRMPFFCWVQLITAFILLLAFPPLEAASFMQLMDRVFGTSFLPAARGDTEQSPGQRRRRRQPAALAASVLVPGASGGLRADSARAWASSRRCLPIIPGARCGVTRRRCIAALGIGFLSFIVWAHHMYLTGMGAAVSTFFQTTTIMISVPSVIILTCLLLSLWGGSIRFTVPMLFATAFLPEFGIGGLTGIPLAFNSTDLYLHDTYYIIAHFHYIVAPGTIFAIFAGVYYWFPKATGRMMNEFWGKVHFWGSVV